MGIIRVHVPKYEPPAKILLTGKSGRVWWWFCEECKKGQMKMFTETDRDLAVRQHRLARHPEYFSKRARA